jgi:hypothetical protein
VNVTNLITLADSTPYLAEARSLNAVGAGLLPATNAAVKHDAGAETSYGRVRAGTVLAKAADGSVHPCGLVTLTAASGGGNSVVTVGAKNAEVFRVGDKVKVIRYQTTRTISDATGEAASDLFTTTHAHGLVIGQRVVSTAKTGGAGFTLGTHYVVAAPSATTFKLSDTPGGAPIDFTTDITALTLVVAVAPPSVADLTGSRHITAINATTGAITLSGANVTAAVGDYLVKELAYRPCGILDRDVLTVEYGADRVTTVPVAKTVPIRHEGSVRSAYIIGLSELVQHALSGAPYPDPLNPSATVAPQVAGFLFKNL